MKETVTWKQCRGVRIRRFNTSENHCRCVVKSSSKERMPKDGRKNGRRKDERSISYGTEWRPWGVRGGVCRAEEHLSRHLPPQRCCTRGAWCKAPPHATAAAHPSFFTRRRLIVPHTLLHRDQDLLDLCLYGHEYPAYTLMGKLVNCETVMLVTITILSLRSWSPSVSSATWPSVDWRNQTPAVPLWQPH